MMVKMKEGCYEIRNGSLGVVIPSARSFKGNQPALAPIISFIYQDGRHSDTTPNFLNAPTNPVSMKVEFLVKTKQEVRVRIEYRFMKTEFITREGSFKGGEAGRGYYRFTLSLKRSEKSALIEEESDYDINYSVDISNGLAPDKARYRGWASNSVLDGYEPSGNPYRSEDQRGYPLDATVNLDYSKTNMNGWFKTWEPAGGEQNTGRYWQFFNSKSDKSANLLGYFQGSPERLIGGRAVGVRLKLTPSNGKVEKSAAFYVEMQRRGPDNSWYPLKRYQWGLFISTKEDLLTPDKTQPIALEMNKYSGIASTILSYMQKPVKLIPAFYKGAIYTDAVTIGRICRQMKTDAALYKRFCEVDGINKQIWDIWRYKDSALSIKNSLLQLYDNLPNIYIHGEGSYQMEYRYWKGTRMFKQAACAVSALFADEQVTISSKEKVKLEKLVGAMARITWDNNNVPLFDSSGVNFGPANMYYMYSNGRSFFALLLANDPEFATRARNVSKNVVNELNSAIYFNGASIGTPHYTQPTLEPILFSMLQLRQSGLENLFETNEKIKKFARFYLNLLTPASVRFMNNRKLISFGDGSEESAAAFGLLAEGFKDKDSSLSIELLHAFHYGPPRGSLFGSVGLAIHLSASGSKKPPIVYSANYEGYLSHFRSAPNTSLETALWVLNGDSLFDHRNDDAGEVALYAIGAPLSLSRSSFYYPHATDGRIRTVVIPENQFAEWNAPKQPINERSLTNRVWPRSESINFAALGKSNLTSIKMTQSKENTWYRKIIQISMDPKLPLFIFYDSIRGSSKNNVWSMTMMSEGPILTPAGAIIPTPRVNNGSSRIELPESSASIGLKEGLNSFLFKGQYWPSHFAKGIDWNFYTLSRDTFQVSFSEWSTTWQNAIEKREFLQSNGKEYVEGQQILRIKGGQSFLNLLFPFQKGINNPYHQNVKIVNDNIISVAQNDDTIYIHNDFYYVKQESGFCGALLSESGIFSHEGVSIEGGFTEVEYDAKKVKIRVGGNAAMRKIHLPFKIHEPTVSNDLEISNHSNGAIIIIKMGEYALNETIGLNGHKEYIFEK